MTDPTIPTTPRKSRPPRRDPPSVVDARHLISSRVVRGTLDEADPEVVAARETIREHELSRPGPTDVRTRWVHDTRLFQRIAGVPEASAAELEAAWDAMRPAHRRRAAEHAREHRIIQKMALNAARNRRS